MHRHKHDAYWGVVPAGSSVSAQSAPAPVSVSAPRPPTSSDPPGLIPPGLIPSEWIRRYAPHGVAPSFVGPPPSGVEDGSMNEVEKLKEAHAKEIEALQEQVEIEKGKAELAAAHVARIQEVRDREKDFKGRLRLSSNPSSPQKKALEAYKAVGGRNDSNSNNNNTSGNDSNSNNNSTRTLQQMRPQQQQQQQQHEDPPKLVGYDDTEDEVGDSGDGVEDGEYDRQSVRSGTPGS